MKNIQVHMPIRRLLKTENRQLVINKRINPEISFNCFDLEDLRTADLAGAAHEISDAGLTVTFHAPFMDLRPGAIDPKIRQITRDRLKQTFDLVPIFRPLTVVCHPSFDGRYYVSNKEAWLENSIATWGFFLQVAEEMDTIITLENVYETEPYLLGRLLASFSAPRIRFCFDTGHFNVFSRTPLEVWLEELSPYLGQLHIHDNDGTGDDHLPVGEGNFPFTGFFAALRKLNLAPLVTVEPHSEADLWKTFTNIEKMELPGDSLKKSPVLP